MNDTKKKVLVVEDLESSRAIVAFHLEKLGCQSTLAENGKQALEESEKTRFDLVLMDLEMPVMNGETTLKKIRSKGNPNQETPIVALTAYADSGDKYRKMGFADILSKPYERIDLHDLLEEYCS